MAAWFSSAHHHHHHHHHHNPLSRLFHDKSSSSYSSSSQTLQILSFETAKTMSRLISLYKFLSEQELADLRNGPMKSQGVMLLNSPDESFLLSLACAEKLQELNDAADFVSRVGQKCSDSSLRSFDRVFSNLKQEIVDADKVEINYKNVEKIIERMEKYVSATASLHAALESLKEIEISDRKLQFWKRNIGPKIPPKTNHSFFQDRLAFHRKQVRHYQEISLWNETFDVSVGLTARIICVIYARVCEFFGPHVSGLPHLSINSVRHISHHMKVHPELHYCVHLDKNKHTRQRAARSSSAPKSSLNNFVSRLFHHESHSSDTRSDKHFIPDTAKHDQQCGSNSQSSTPKSRNNLGLRRRETGEKDKRNRLLELAPPATVGAAGLAIRYANIIILAEKFLRSPLEVNDETRMSMYELLPASLKGRIRKRLWTPWTMAALEEGDGGFRLGDVWRGPLEDMLAWLAPMAQDTLRWHAEKATEMQKFTVKSTVLLFQTLHFSNLEKTDSAISDLLVGLCFIYRFEYKRKRNSGCGSWSP